MRTKAGDQGWASSGPSARTPAGDSGGFSEEKPVKVGQELEVEIAEMSRRGDGIARIQGFVVFVPGAPHGQKLKIRITGLRPNFAVAEIVEPKV